jgi:hypothetical protein
MLEHTFLAATACRYTIMDRVGEVSCASAQAAGRENVEDAMFDKNLALPSAFRQNYWIKCKLLETVL